jgi:anthranilate phosphoribosyltransferase
VATNNYEKVFKPADFGFELTKPEELVAGATQEEATRIFDHVLEDKALPGQKNVVVINAAFGIQTLEKGKKSISECIEIARSSIENGKALAAFRKFKELNQ